MRWLVALAALAIATPLTAQDVPEWTGVWEGRIGEYPVLACLSSSGDGLGRGSYYYLSALEPIAVSQDDPGSEWVERAVDGERQAVWDFSALTADAASGSWKQGGRNLAFDLKPVKWTEGEWGGPCSSAEFMEPRLTPGTVESEAADLDGWKFTRLTYKPPKQFTEDVAAVSFSFTAEQPGDRDILAELAAHLPKGTMDDEFVDCLGGAISSLGTDGMYDSWFAPTMVSKAYLSVEESSGTFCGGAHPNYYTVMHTFDRQSGEEIDLFGWTGEERIDGEDSIISPDLRKLVLARWPKDQTECLEYIADAEYWRLGLAKEGMVFRPDVPHVATPCAEPVVVEWGAMAPFLDDEGKSGLARLKQG